MKGYRRFAFFFHPMFNSFSLLIMQTENDKKNMADLGMGIEKITVLGNLKFDIQMLDKQQIPPALSKLLPSGKLVITAGSTHPGEEEILFTAFKRLQNSHPEIMMLLAPRDPDRADQIAILAKQHGLTTTLRSQTAKNQLDILIIDSMGELIYFYAMADIGVVGGSLVKEGGHNPIEPAVFSIPVLFGPYMEDFQEIANSLINAGGGEQVTDVESLEHTLRSLLDSEQLRREKGTAARHWVNRQRGVIGKHLEVLKPFM